MAEYYKSRGDENKYLGSLRGLFRDPELNVDDKIKSLLPYLENLDQISDPNLMTTLVELGRAIAETHASEAKAHAMYADLLLHTGQLTPALDAYRRTLALNTSKATVWNNYLLVCAQLGNFEELAEKSAEATDLFPNDAMGPFYNGMANLRLSRYDQALTALGDAQLLAGRNTALRADVLSLQGSAQARKGDFPKAVESFEKALQLNPDSYIALNEYSYTLLQRSENLSKAAELSRRAVELAPGNLVFLDNYARVLYKLKNYKEARGVLDKALAQGGEVRPEMLEFYGDVLFRLNLTNDAVQYWQRAMEKGAHSDVLNRKVNTRSLEE
jgi:tetratricopeptide (TPR) repeat protein